MPLRSERSESSATDGGRRRSSELGIVAGISVMLSVASLYALMAFTVERRTREIGLRSALGAPPA